MPGLPFKPRLLWAQATGSFWFVPGLIVTAAIGLAFVLVEADAWVAPERLAAWPRLLGAGVDGARALLAAVATSMITVAGVVFSITLVALSLTSSQYSPRVLRNFMRNRVNQAVLGTFVGIFAYCLVVLRTVRAPAEAGTEFVPAIAVFAGLVLGVVGILVLVFFIHHIAMSIQTSGILATVFEETVAAARGAMHEREASPAEDEEPLPAPREASVLVGASRTGYVQAIDERALVACARQHDTVLWVEVAVGDFVSDGISLLRGTDGLPERSRQRLRDAFSIDTSRTAAQDVGFGIRQLVDVALKGLSPGINDTTTAVMAVDYLTALLRLVARWRIRCHLRSPDGALRVVRRVPSFCDLVHAAFDQIRHHGEGNVAMLTHLLRSLERLHEVVVAPPRRAALVEVVRELEASIRRSIAVPEQAALLRQAEELLGRLASPRGPSSA